MDYETHPRGQPSVAEQQQIDMDAYPFYLKTYSIETTARLINRNRHTIKKRYARWDNENMVRLKNEFDRGDSVHLIEYRHLNQTLIEPLLDQFFTIQQDIVNARKNGDLHLLPNLIATLNQLARTLDILGAKRCAVKMHPGSERVVETVFDEKIKKYVQSGTGN